ncbi:hypothetical protein C2R22_03555 [Salinigranum rubrum]|uniref:Uncharacterized protein n=1 Tax=Salinigranum rubrum TaxID=755307 RepID=A0A2I8VFZ3_9EURY|nr:hypothetical protein [Salinigranum rubrum]AUV80850.1 hypothetical protein C2R22_03555 [Salinigranum rubrum]
MSGGANRGQVVVLAAVVVAVALVAMATAYHGLAYHGDVRTTTEIGTGDPMSVAERHLQRSVNEAAVGPVRPWAERGQTVNDTRAALGRARENLRQVAAADRSVFVVRENSDVAAEWADSDCPGDAQRAFGPCVADGGIVVQERANETALVGVALDVVHRSPTGETTATVRVRAR